MQSAVHAHGPQKAAKRGVLKVGPILMSFVAEALLKTLSILGPYNSAERASPFISADDGVWTLPVLATEHLVPWPTSRRCARHTHHWPAAASAPWRWPPWPPRPRAAAQPPRQRRRRLSQPRLGRGGHRRRCHSFAPRRTNQPAVACPVRVRHCTHGSTDAGRRTSPPVCNLPSAGGVGARSAR